MTPLIDTKAVSVWLGTSVRHIRGLLDTDAIPFIYVGRLIRFNPLEIAKWIEEHHHAAKPGRGGRCPGCPLG